MLPLTLATTLCLLVRVSGQTLALPITNVVRMTRLAPDEIGRAEGREGIHVDGRPVVLTRLADALEFAAPESQDGAASRQPAIILGAAEKRVAFLVDAVVGTQEVVIKRLPRPLNRVRYTAGATILGSGEVVMILNVADLIRSAGGSVSRVGRTTRPAAVTATDTARVLVVDDSIVTRMLEKGILEAAGYEVQVASDGIEAWNLLQATACDVMVSDINMPKMDGLKLTEKVRASDKLRNLPIVLVTSLDSPEDRERGVASGADAYIVKSSFSQDGLLDTIRRLM